MPQPTGTTGVILGTVAVATLLMTSFFLGAMFAVGVTLGGGERAPSLRQDDNPAFVLPWSLLESSSAAAAGKGNGGASRAPAGSAGADWVGGVFGSAADDVNAFLNSPEAEKARWDAAIAAKVDRYRHPEELGTAGRAHLKMLLRAVTGNLPGHTKLPEPFTADGGRRQNSGCQEREADCLLTWDGWARAMAAGDILYDVIHRGIPGAVVEVGVFKGGLSAYLQGMLLVTGEAERGREMWLVDSFKGLPPTSLMKSANDKSGNEHNSAKGQEFWAGKLSIGLRTVWDNLDRLGLMDAGNVHFLEGWVQDTLPGWNKTKTLALLRVDVDIYSATFDTLHFLYPLLEKGGAVLFDDWKLSYSRDAVINYRKEHGITTPVRFLHGCIDPMAYWIKE